MLKAVLFTLALLGANQVAATEKDTNNNEPQLLTLAAANTGYIGDNWVLGPAESTISWQEEKSLNAFTIELNRKIRQSLTKDIERKYTSQSK